MLISIHLGAHCTESDKLLRSLLKNKGVLAERGTAVPGPSRYRDLLVRVTSKLQGQRASASAQDVVFDAILDNEDVDRVVLSNENFLSIHQKIFEGGEMYANAGLKSMWLRNVFPDNPVEFHIGIRNLATFVPEAFHHRHNGLPWPQYIGQTDLGATKWSDVIADIREANPDCPITVWCNEDTPLTWLQIMREVAGFEQADRLVGGFDILSTIMKREGMKRLRAYLKTHTPQNEIQRRRVLGAFLDKYAIDDAIEDEIDLPGWTQDVVEELSEAYEEDLFELRRIPGVNFIEA